MGSRDRGGGRGTLSQSDKAILLTPGLVSLAVPGAVGSGTNHPHACSDIQCKPVVK